MKRGGLGKFLSGGLEPTSTGKGTDSVWWVMFGLWHLNPRNMWFVKDQ